MVAVTQLLLPILLSAVLVFVVSAIIHMFTPWHAGDFAKLPDEDKVKYSAMTGQSLFYLGEKDLRHKVLAIVEEEGVRQAAYALKLLQSEGELTIASTGKDPATGKLTTHEYRVEGPVMIFLTTTAAEIDEELLNRCLVLTVNEDREQTRAIHKIQRERQTLSGLLSKQDREETLKIHRNAQRLLRPLLVANPYADRLTFLSDRTRTRRDHGKYLTLIRTVTLLHQHQREIKTVAHRGKTVEFIEASLEDIAMANRLAHEVLGRTLDELPPQSRRLLGLIDEMVAKECERLAVARSEYRFTRREVRERTGWGDTQLKIHLGRLSELEYLLLHRGRGNGFAYELLYDGRGEGRISPPSRSARHRKVLLRHKSAGGKRGSVGGKRRSVGVRSAPGRPPVGGWSG